MKKAILLCRVSTDTQDYEAQISDLKRYAESKGMTECYVVATKESGFKNITEREGWVLTKEYFETHPDYDTLIATEISRLGRRETAIAEIKEYLEINKKSLFIKDLDLQLLDHGKKKPESDIVFSVFASMATTEMSVKKERFRRAKRELSEQGYSIVGPVPFGYSRVRDAARGKNKFIVNEQQAKEINELYNIYVYGLDGKDIGIKGLMWYAISKGMSSYLHSKRNITKLLGERAYIGGVKEVRTKKKNPEYWKFNDHSKTEYIETCSKIPYPQIVSKDLFDAVQKKKLDNRTLVDKSVKHTTILSKLIECPECHTFMIGDYRKKGKTATYRCAKHKGTAKCNNSSMLSMPYIDTLVWCYLKANVKQIIEEISKKDYDKDISEIENKIENLHDKKKSLQQDTRTLDVVFKKDVKILGFPEAQKKYNTATDDIEKQIDDIDKLIGDYNKKITEIQNTTSTTLTDEDMERVENDKSRISEYIHLLVRKILCYNWGTYTFVRVILNGDNDRTFRGIIANKRDTIRIQAFGFKKEGDMPFIIRNKETKNNKGEIIEWVEDGYNQLGMLACLDKLELYPIDFKRLKVYDEDMK